MFPDTSCCTLNTKGVSLAKPLGLGSSTHGLWQFDPFGETKQKVNEIPQDRPRFQTVPKKAIEVRSQTARPFSSSDLLQVCLEMPWMSDLQGAMVKHSFRVLKSSVAR